MITIQISESQIPVGSLLTNPSNIHDNYRVDHVVTHNGCTVLWCTHTADPSPFGKGRTLLAFSPGVLRASVDEYGVQLSHFTASLPPVSQPILPGMVLAPSTSIRDDVAQQIDTEITEMVYHAPKPAPVKTKKYNGGAKTTGDERNELHGRIVKILTAAGKPLGVRDIESNLMQTKGVPRGVLGYALNTLRDRGVIRSVGARRVCAYLMTPGSNLAPAKVKKTAVESPAPSAVESPVDTSRLSPMGQLLCNLVWAGRDQKKRSGHELVEEVLTTPGMQATKDQVTSMIYNLVQRGYLVRHSGKGMSGLFTHPTKRP